MTNVDLASTFGRVDEYTGRYFLVKSVQYSISIGLQDDGQNF